MFFKKSNKDVLPIANCGSCVHSGAGKCKLNPPIPFQIDGGGTAWSQPSVNRNDWCSNFVQSKYKEAVTGI